MDDEYQIVGTQEVDPVMGRISDESPIGRALMGRHVGEIVDIEAPGGHMQCRIISVTR